MSGGQERERQAGAEPSGKQLEVEYQGRLRCTRARCRQHKVENSNGKIMQRIYTLYNIRRAGRAQRTDSSGCAGDGAQWATAATTSRQLEFGQLVRVKEGDRGASRENNPTTSAQNESASGGGGQLRVKMSGASRQAGQWGGL